MLNRLVSQSGERIFNAQVFHLLDHREEARIWRDCKRWITAAWMHVDGGSTAPKTDFYAYAAAQSVEKSARNWHLIWEMTEKLNTDLQALTIYVSNHSLNQASC